MRLTLLNQFYAPDISPTAQHRRLTRRAPGRPGRRRHRDRRPGGLPRGPRADRRRRRRVARAGPAGLDPDLGKASIARRLIGYVTYLVGAAAPRPAAPPPGRDRGDDHPAARGRWSAAPQGSSTPAPGSCCWSMDCYPDVAERFGEIWRRGRSSRALDAITRRAFRHLDHVVALDGAMADLLTSQYGTWSRAPPCTDRAQLGAACARLTRPRPPGEPQWTWAPPPPSGRVLVALHGQHRGRPPVRHRGRRRLTVLNDDVRFTFVGGGARIADLETAIEDRSLNNIVTHGYVPKATTPALLRQADAAPDHPRRATRSGSSAPPSSTQPGRRAAGPLRGSAGSNVDEAIRRFDCGSSISGGRRRRAGRRGPRPALGGDRGRRAVSARGPRLRRGAYMRRATPSPGSTDPRRAHRLRLSSPRSRRARKSRRSSPCRRRAAPRAPSRAAPCLGDVGAALGGVVDRQRLVHDLADEPVTSMHQLGAARAIGELARVADVDRPGVRRRRAGPGSPAPRRRRRQNDCGSASRRRRR